MKEISEDNELLIQAFKQQEQKIVDNLKLAETKKDTHQQIEYLIALGDVHIKKGDTKIKPYERHQYTRAMALYYSAYNRAVTKEQKKAVFEKIEFAEHSFLKSIDIESKITSTDEIDDYKKILSDLREWCKEELILIDKKYDITKIEDEKEKQPIENQRAEHVRNIQEKIQKTIGNLLTSMITAAIQKIGEPPCKYTIIGFGSFAECRMTPYSDLEFGILVEEETEENLEYFRNLTELTHLKVIHLGETVLRPMKITALTDNYFDNFSKNGLKFDSFRHGGCKTPLGNRKEEGTIEFELIHTPKEMAKFQELGNEALEKQHLPIGLFSAEYMIGDEQLLIDYRKEVQTVLETGEKKPHIERGLKVLKEATGAFHIDLFSPQEEGKTYDVKQEIYRLSDRVVAALCLYLGIYEINGWKKIAALESIIGKENGLHFTVIFSLASEVRLRSYLDSGEQQDKWAAKAFGILFDRNNPFDIFFRYYYRALVLEGNIEEFLISSNKKLLGNVCFDDNLYYQSIIHKKLMHYEKSLACCLSYIEKNPNNTAALSVAGGLFERLGQFKKAISYSEQALSISKELYGEKHPNVAAGLNNLGIAYQLLGDTKKTADYHEQALSISKELYGEKHLAVAANLNNLGGAYQLLGDAKKAVDYHEQALAIRRELCGEKHPDVATSLNNLGATYASLGDAKKAVYYYAQALTIRRELYGENYPDIAISLNNLGIAYRALGDAKKAVDYHTQALAIRRKLYGEKHPDVAASLNNLGIAYSQRKEVQSAFYYLWKAYALDLIYSGESHPDTRSSKTNLSIFAAAFMNQLFLKGERNTAQQYKKFEGIKYKNLNQYYEHAHSNPKKTAILLPIAYAQVLIKLAPWESEGYYELAKALLLSAIDTQTKGYGQYTQRVVERVFDNMKKALELNSCAHYQAMHAYFLLNQGKYDDAIKQARQLLESLSQSNITNDNVHFNHIDDHSLLPTLLQSYLSVIKTMDYSAKTWALLVLISSYQQQKKHKVCQNLSELSG